MQTTHTHTHTHTHGLLDPVKTASPAANPFQHTWPLYCLSRLPNWKTKLKLFTAYFVGNSSCVTCLQRYEHRVPLQHSISVHHTPHNFPISQSVCYQCSPVLLLTERLLQQISNTRSDLLFMRLVSVSNEELLCHHSSSRVHE